MRMASFIRENLEPIIERWEDFAGTILSARDMDRTALRDHAREMLTLITEDLDEPQSKSEQADKSKGLAQPDAEAKAYVQHGVGRFTAGFSIDETVSEFRALRACVIDLWGKEGSATDKADFQDLIRFNEAIDQAIAESISSYAAEKEMQARLLETVLSASPDHIAILGVDGTYMYVNDAAAELYEMPANEVIGKKCADLHSSFAATMQDHLQEVVDTAKPYRNEFSYSSPHGISRRFEYILAPVTNENKATDAIVGIGRDITERTAAEEKTWQSANFDVLTGLPNRRLFRNRLEQEMATSLRSDVPLALFFIDLDRFKAVNDLLGHDAGDNLLRQAAERIASCVRTTDTVSRLGGDEFTVVLTQLTEVTHAGVVAQKIIEELAKPFQLGQNIAHVSGSIGVTIFPKDAVEPQNLVRNADHAMYAAKKAGRNQVSFFTPAAQVAALAHLKLLNEIREALTEQQLQVYYQPIIELSTGHVVKAEALVRWLHPQRGLLMPSQFIGLAEEAGLMADIDSWVFTEAASHTKRWSELLGHSFQVSVNRSSVQIIRDDTRLGSESYLRTIGSERRSMLVEVNEEVLLATSTSTRKALDDLKQAGIGLAIDAYGAGHSSLARLQEFDVDYLKIDQSFVQDSSPGSRIVAETIIIMAHKLGLKVIGQGVETPEQRAWLKETGCDYAQGYLFSEAIPADALGKLLADHAPKSS